MLFRIKKHYELLEIFFSFGMVIFLFPIWASVRLSYLIFGYISIINSDFLFTKQFLEAMDLI